MKRTTYKGYVIDEDDLGRPYIYSTASKYSEDSDRILISIDGSKKQITQAKAIIDRRIENGEDLRHACFAPDGSIYVF